MEFSEKLAGTYIGGRKNSRQLKSPPCSSYYCFYDFQDDLVIPGSLSYPRHVRYLCILMSHPTSQKKRFNSNKMAIKHLSQ